MDFNLDDYYVSKIRIKKGKSYTKDDYYCRWYDVSLNIKNKYFTYNETRECLLESELWEIYNNIDKCLNNKMNENKNLSFIEPDLEIELSKSDDENHIHLCDFKIFINLEGVAGCDYYSFTLDDEDMIRFKDYIKNVLENKNHSDEEQYKTYNYVSVVYDDDIVAKTINEPSFYYKTDINDISVGDKVLVDRTGKQVVGIVVDIEEFDEEDVPFPIDKTKDIIKVLEKTNEDNKSDNGFYIDPCDHYMLIVHDLKNIDEKLDLYRTYTIRNDSKDLEELIKKCDIIITIGNINISKYNLSDKYVVNINNENNYGRHTAISHVSNQNEYIDLIKAINYGLFYTGFITIDLYDIENGINGRIKYKKYAKNEKEQIFKDFDVKNAKKIFVVFEAPTNSNLYEISDIAQEFRDKYEDIEFSFGVPVMDNVDELKINVFYESNIICPNCGSKLVDIIYGMPSAEIGEKAKKGELFLGGCMISDNDPSYHCNNCRRSYYENLNDYIEEPNNFE